MISTKSSFQSCHWLTPRSLFAHWHHVRVSVQCRSPKDVAWFFIHFGFLSCYFLEVHSSFVSCLVHNEFGALDPFHLLLWVSIKRGYFFCAPFRLPFSCRLGGFIRIIIFNRASCFLWLFENIVPYFSQSYTFLAICSIITNSFLLVAALSIS